MLPNIVLSQNIFIVGGLFSAFSGVYELYHTTLEQSNINILMRVGAHMTGGFIYGMSLTYFWQLPTALSLYKLGEGFYGR
uniref:Uncharacterized protein n=1 Tax=viral metagenome TaxID=1070528 RepID=A0A6C0B7B3_9ZZZZ